MRRGHETVTQHGKTSMHSVFTRYCFARAPYTIAFAFSQLFGAAGAMLIAAFSLGSCVHSIRVSRILAYRNV